MCFSATASYTAALLLGSVGIFLMKKTKPPSLKWLTMIPLFFAIQQFSEGILWTTLDYGVYPNLWGLSAQRVFLFFAYLFWPLWIPLSFMHAETETQKKKKFWPFLFGGFVLFLFNTIGFTQEGITPAEIIQCSIHYGGSTLSHRILYALITLTPFFLSSLRGTKLLGIALTLSFILSDLFYHHAFTSIWCFFAAIVCLGLFWIVKTNKPK